MCKHRKLFGLVRLEARPLPHQSVHVKMTPLRPGPGLSDWKSVSREERVGIKGLDRTEHDRNLKNPGTCRNRA